MSELKGCMIEIEKGQYVSCRDTTIGNVLCDNCKKKETDLKEGVKK